MPLERLRFSVDGDVEYSRAFQVMAHEMGDMSDPLSEVGESLRQAVGRQFETEGAYGGGRPWARLDREYAAWKDEHFPGRPILVQTGDMRAAALSPGAVQVTPRKLRYEVDDDKAIYHQRGSGHLPQRKLVDLPASERRSWDRIFANWLNGLRRGPLRSSGQAA